MQPNVLPVGLKLPRLYVVLQAQFKHVVSQHATQGRVVYWNDHLDPAIEVSRHPIGASDIDLLLSTVAEVEDTAVLQESSDDRDDAYVLGKVGNAGPQAADAPDNKIDLHSARRRSIEAPDEFRVY